MKPKSGPRRMLEKALKNDEKDTPVLASEREACWITEKRETCNEKLTKQPNKIIRTLNLFGMILYNFGTIFGGFLGSRARREILSSGRKKTCSPQRNLFFWTTHVFSCREIMFGSRKICSCSLFAKNTSSGRFVSLVETCFLQWRKPLFGRKLFFVVEKSLFVGRKKQ